MENRFGFKDLVTSVLLLAILVSIWLAMQQYNRQWEQVRLIAQRQSEISSDMRQMLNAIRAGAVATGGGQGATAELGKPDAFDRIRDARAHDDFAPGDWVLDAFAVNVEKITPLVSTDIYQSVVENYVVDSLATRDPDTLEWKAVLARDWEIEDNTQQWERFVDEQLEDAEPLTEDDIRQDPEFQSLTAQLEEQLDDEDEIAEHQQAYIDQRIEDGPGPGDVLRNADDAPPAMTITFQMRENAQFSDGEPVTAHDVVFTFELAMNPEINAPRARAYLQRFSEVEAIDDHTVVFRAEQPYFRLFDFAAGMEVLPEHFYEQFTPSQINEEPGLLMGSGPYRLPSPTDWSPGEREVRLVRNDRYWGEDPTFDELWFRMISADHSRLQEFRNRDLDVFNPTPEQHVEMLEDEQLRERTQHYEYQTVTSGYRFIAWNQRRRGEETRFADRRVRQAMTMLTDRQRIIDQIYYGYAQLASGPFHPAGPQFNENVEPWPHDVQRARELLAEAGWEQDGDGVLRDSDGNAFRFDLTYPANSDTAEDMARFLRDAYARVGIELNTDPLDWSIFRERLQGRQFDAITLGWSGTLEGDPYQIFHSNQIAEGGDNFVSYRNEQLDELIETARETVIEDERMPMWHEVHEILHEDQPYTFLMHGDSLRWLDERFRNVHEVTLGLNDRLEWYVPSPEQRWTN